MPDKTQFDSFENKPPAIIVNDHGGSISITNKTGKEKVNITHRSGASIELNPVQTSIFSPENRSDVTNNDEFKTIKGDLVEYVNSTKSVSVNRDLVTTIGNAKAFLSNAPQQFLNKWGEIAAPFVKGDLNRPLRYVVAGLPIDQYPEDSGEAVTIRLNDALEQLKNNFCSSLTSNLDNPPVLNDFLVDFDELFTLIKEAITVITGSIYTAIDDLITTITQEAIDAFYEILNELVAELKQLLFEVLCQFLTVPAQLVEFVNAYLNSISQAVRSVIDPLIKEEPQSSEGNTYTQNDKSSLHEYLIQKNEELLAYEQALGVGGNSTTNILKNKMVNIGGGFNMTSPISIDPHGTEVAAAPLIDKWQGVTTLNGGIPKLERSTINDACDVGNYTITIGNKFNILTGGGGVRIDTNGPLDLQAPMINLVGHGVDMSGEVVKVNASSGILFDSKNFLTLRAPFSIALDGNCQVTKNMVVQGGSYINGELYVNHITAPLEMQETMEQESATGIFTPEATFIFTNLTPLIGTEAGGVVTIPSQAITFQVTANIPGIDPVTVKPHIHKFPNIPLRLTKGTTINSETGLDAFDVSDPLALGFNSAHSKLRELAQATLSTETANAYKINEGNKWDQALT
jgi:hypothetical protein